MQTKLSTLKAAAAAQDWQGALRITAKFADLGEQKVAIKRGHEAHSNARFAVQLGRDPAADIEAGIQALCARYSLNRDGTENTAKTYGRKDNCIRAARKALGADAQQDVAFTLAQGEAGWTWAAIVVEPVPVVEAVTAPQAPALRGRYREMADAAARGVLPAVPDFSANTHKAYRKRLAQAVNYVEAGDLDSLRGFPLKVSGSSSRALARYIGIATAAIEAGQLGARSVRTG